MVQDSFGSLLRERSLPSSSPVNAWWDILLCLGIKKEIILFKPMKTV
jgi:hypothetical protein